MDYTETLSQLEKQKSELERQIRKINDEINYNARLSAISTTQKTIIEKLATCLHEIFCSECANSRECGWCYDVSQNKINWNGYTTRYYFEAAMNLLRLSDINTCNESLNQRFVEIKTVLNKGSTNG